MYYLLKPEDESIKELYHSEKKSEKVVNGLPVDQLRESGYSEADIEAMKLDIGKGMMNE